MNELHSLLVFLFIAISAITIHETAHYVSARMCRVRVIELGIGFPPRLWTIKNKFGCDVSINLLMLGGYVVLHALPQETKHGGCNDGEIAHKGFIASQSGGQGNTPSEDKGAICDRKIGDEKGYFEVSPGKRIWIACSGAMLNMLLGLSLLVTAHACNGYLPTHSTYYIAPFHWSRLKEHWGERAEHLLQHDDRLIRVANIPIESLLTQEGDQHQHVYYLTKRYIQAHKQAEHEPIMLDVITQKGDMRQVRWESIAIDGARNQSSSDGLTSNSSDALTNSEQRSAEGGEEIGDEQSLAILRVVDRADLHYPGWRSVVRSTWNDVVLSASSLTMFVNEVLGPRVDRRWRDVLLLPGLGYNEADIVQRHRWIRIAGIVNIIVSILSLAPFPGHDGGRIILAAMAWGKAKGISPRREENMHQIGAWLTGGLILVMILIGVIRRLWHI